MRYWPILLALLACCAGADALSVGVVPDRLVFSEGAEQASIINPNNATLSYRILSEQFNCEPSQGIIGPQGRADLLCTAMPGAENDIILVETEGEDGSVGLLPAVAIKAEVSGIERKKDAGQEAEESEDEAENPGPLSIIRETEPAGQERAGLFQEMRTEMLTIIL
ncbi:hypothetical protein KY363_05700, partial [Candidatus Woesearchaeota archaeon]|nr:hypothetical protein [Candidatus Woesearchaeota archaeon]